MKNPVSFEAFQGKLDLEPIVFSLTQREGGPCWSLEKSRFMEKWYRRFLYLTYLNPGQGIVPTKDLDIFWHTHILDTQKYMDDCERLFGYYFHHFPYFGMRGEEDRKNLEHSFKKTEELYLKCFGESFRSFEIADCGALCNEPVPKNSTIDLGSELRPSLANAAF